MTARLIFLALLVPVTAVMGQGGGDAPPLPPPLQAAAGRPWLGLKLSRVDPSVSAQIQGLPPGVGFVIKSIEEGGPAEGGKFKPFDIVWKMGDQLLINEAQLATLLRLHKPGEEIKLSIFRGGQPLEVGMKLGDLPAGRDGFSHELAEVAILPGESGPMRVVNVSDRTATFTTEEGKIVLKKENDLYLLVITNPKEEVIFQGDVTQREGLDEIPEPWKNRVQALRRGLDHQLQGALEPVRAPRPRVVPIAPSAP